MPAFLFSFCGGYIDMDFTNCVFFWGSIWVQSGTVDWSWHFLAFPKLWSFTVTDHHNFDNTHMLCWISLVDQEIISMFSSCFFFIVCLEIDELYDLHCYWPSEFVFFWIEFADYRRASGRSEGCGRHAPKEGRDGEAVWCFYCLTRFFSKTILILMNILF